MVVGDLSQVWLISTYAAVETPPPALLGLAVAV